MEIPQPATTALDDQEESVRIAVRALGDMRNNARSDPQSSRPTLPTSTPSSSTLASSSSSSSQPRNTTDVSPTTPTSPDFVSRMSHFPLVKTALRTYEQGKASSRVVKYGAEMMESSVKTISRPVIDRLPVNVNQLDEFACRQLDRLDKYRRPSNGDGVSLQTESNPDNSRGRPKLKTKTLDGSVDDQDVSMSNNNHNAPAEKGRRSRRDVDDRGIPRWLEANSPFVEPPPPPPDSTSRSSTPTQNDESSPGQIPERQHERQVAQRSRWQAVLLEAGGLSAALSEESMRRLKYCLQWLQYATAHIDAQILILRDFTASLQTHPPASSSSRHVPDEHMRKLTDVRRDIVFTIRQVVDVVSKYAGGALPEPARVRVRGFILKLPQRWASKAGVGGVGSGPSGPNGGATTERERERDAVTAAASGTGTGVRRSNRRAAYRERGPGSSAASEAGLRSGTSSRAASPASPRTTRNTNSTESGTVLAGTAIVASQRILTLATESLDMMRGVTGVMKDSLDRADAWVGRLRTVGIQRATQDGDNDAMDGDGSEFEFAHRRSGSSSYSQSQFDESELSESTAWVSSIPSTPGGSYAMMPAAGSYAALPNRSYPSNAPSPASYPSPANSHTTSAPSPGPINLGSMSLGSRYHTPKRGVSGLPVEGDQEALKGTKPETEENSTSSKPLNVEIHAEGMSGVEEVQVEEKSIMHVREEKLPEPVSSPGGVKVAGVDRELDGPAKDAARDAMDVDA